MGKLPHKYYIKALIAGRCTNRQIASKLRKLNLYLPDTELLTEWRGQMQDEQPDYFEKKKRHPEVNWLQNHGVEKMVAFKFDVPVSSDISHMEDMFRLLLDPKLYKAITTLLIGGLPREDIELVVNAKYDLELTSNHIDDFIHYFFDVEDWSYHEKTEYIGRLKNKTLRSYYKMSLAEDPDFVLWKLDLDPRKDLNQMLQEMSSDCFFNFKDSANKNPSDAFKWGKLLLKVNDKLDEYDEEMKEKSNREEETQDLFADIRQPKNKKEKQPEVDVSEQDSDPDIVSLEDLN